MRREQRLRARRDFDAAFGGVRVSRGVLSLRARERGDHAPSRFGFAVSSRLGGAVLRNRIKRRLRESARRSDVRGFDFVVIARNGAQQADFQALHESLSALIRLAVQRCRAGGGRDR